MLSSAEHAYVVIEQRGVSQCHTLLVVAYLPRKQRIVHVEIYNPLSDICRMNIG